MPKKVEINPKTAPRMKEFLKESGLKQKELAELIFCSQQYISNIVNGKCGLSVYTAKEIAKHYSIRIEYLLGEDDYKTEGAMLKEMLESERKHYHKCFSALISIAEEAGYSIVLEDGWKIKRGNTVCCKCSEDTLEVLVTSFVLHTEQHIKDFINLVTLK